MSAVADPDLQISRGALVVQTLRWEGGLGFGGRAGSQKISFGPSGLSLF